MKKNMIHKLNFWGLFTLLCMGMTSCSEDESYDFSGDPVTRVFVKKISSLSNFIHTPVSSISTLDFKMPVYTTLNAETTIKAMIEVDNSLVKVYNEQYGKTYEALPDGAIQVENNILTIPVGAMRSSDSIHITVNEAMLPELRSDKGYVIPLKMTQVDGENAAASTNLNSAYLIINTVIDHDMIKDNASYTDREGNLIEVRDGWTAWLSDPQTTTISEDIAGILDGNTKTNCTMTSSDSFSFVVDAGKEYKATGLEAYYYTSSWGGTREYQALKSGGMVEYSMNGSDWSEIGVIPTMTINCLIFNAPIAARYFRITVPAKKDWYGKKTATITIGEFRIYAK